MMRWRCKSPRRVKHVLAVIFDFAIEEDIHENNPPILLE